MANQRIIVGNWKMNGCRALANELLSVLARSTPSDPARVKVVLCPPATLLSDVKSLREGTPIVLGAQDCHAKTHGAYTGDISAAMLKEVGCQYVILGHSERREQYGETDALVAAKALSASSAGLIPIICVGESLSQRQRGDAEAFVAQQLRSSLPELPCEIVIAYEPIWAIGTGYVPTVEDITAMHHTIAQVLVTQRGPLSPRASILYGGSVKASNAKEILDLPGVDGVLVGGASLIAEEFSAIVSLA